MADLKIKRSPSVESNDRAWLQVYDDINEIINAVNNKSGTESRTKGTLGNDGDIRLFKDSDATKYFIEGKFKDGWAKRELLFTDTDETYQSEIINTSETENYVRKDGTVAFTAVVGGVDPTASSHLSTKGYVDTQVTAQDLDFQADSGGALNIDLDSETLTITGGNGIGTVGSGNAITINHDDTSSVSNADNSGTTFIQDLTFDTYGHVTARTSAAIPEYDPVGGVNTGVVDTSDTYSGGDPSANNFTSYFLRKDGGWANPLSTVLTFKTVSWVPSGGGTPYTTVADATDDTLTITAGTGIQVALTAADHTTISSTHSVGDGGLTQNNFTDADHSKLDGIAANANNYTHPSVNHIPTGGSSNQYLKYSSSGTAAWADLPVTSGANTLSDSTLPTTSGYAGVYKETSSQEIKFYSLKAGTNITLDKNNAGGEANSYIEISASATTVSNANWTGVPLAVANGGTGATSAGDARTNLSAAAANHNHDGTYAAASHSHSYASISGSTSNGVMIFSSGTTLATSSDLIYNAGTLTVNKTGNSDGIVRIEADEGDSNESHNPYLIFSQDGNEDQSAVYMTSNQLIISNSATASGGISIRTNSSSNDYSVGTERLLIESGGDFMPGGNGTQDFGSASKKLDIVYANGYYANDAAGLTATKSFTIGSNNHTVTIKGGIITGWDIFQ